MGAASLIKSAIYGVPPASLPVPSSVSTTVKGLLEASPEDVDKAIRKLPDYKSLDDAAKLELRALGVTLYHLSKAGMDTVIDGGRLTLSQITKATKVDGEDVMGFTVPYLQHMYVSWKATRAAGADKSPQAYMDAVRASESRVATLFKHLLGTNYSQITKKARKPSQQSDPWIISKIFSRVLPKVDDPLGELLTLVKNREELKKAITSSVEHIRLKGVSEEAGFADEFFTVLFANDSKNIDFIVDRIEYLFKKHSKTLDLNDLSPEDMRKILGKYPHSPQKAIDEILLGQALLYKELLKFTDNATDAQELMGHFLKLEGSEDFFYKLLRQQNHEHGYIFEQLVTLGALKHQLAEAAKNGRGIEDALDLLLLQTQMGKRSGPDLIALVWRDVGTDQAALVSKLIQMKSYQDIQSLLRNSSSGDMIKQLKSDVTRIIQEGGLQAFDNPALGTTNLIGSLIDPEILYKIDWARIEKSGFDVDLDELIGMVEDTALQARMLADKSAVFKSTDPAISSAIREAFAKKHVYPQVDILNTEMAGFRLEWLSKFTKDGDRVLSTDEILSVVKSEFQYDKVKSISDEWIASGAGSTASPQLQKLDALVSAIQGADSPAKASEAIAKMYDDAFAWPAGGDAISVQVELVDGIIQGLKAVE